MIEALFVSVLFSLYLLLWSTKRARLIKQDHIDPQVMAKSSSNVQVYMNRLTRVLTGYLLLLIPLHAFKIRIFGLFDRFSPLDAAYLDGVGFSMGLIGLSFCLYAQVKMGKSWRVGIDQNAKTDLITTGLYAWVRNPTYLGLFILCSGVWLIWPTFAMFLFCGVFILFLEIQVRCEEDHLERLHPIAYGGYKKKTKRYLPFIY